MIETEEQAARRFLATLLALTFVMNMVARGVTETFAVFLLPVQQGLGLSRTEITLTYSVIANLTFGQVTVALSSVTVTGPARLTLPVFVTR